MMPAFGRRIRRSLAILTIWSVLLSAGPMPVQAQGMLDLFRRVSGDAVKQYGQTMMNSQLGRYGLPPVPTGPASDPYYQDNRTYDQPPGDHLSRSPAQVQSQPSSPPAPSPHEYSPPADSRRNTYEDPQRPAQQAQPPMVQPPPAQSALPAPQPSYSTTTTTTPTINRRPSPFGDYWQRQYDMSRGKLTPAVPQPVPQTAAQDSTPVSPPPYQAPSPYSPPVSPPTPVYSASGNNSNAGSAGPASRYGSMLERTLQTAKSKLQPAISGARSALHPASPAAQTRDVTVVSSPAQRAQADGGGGHDYALLFATDTYDDPSFKGLSNPVHDAQSIAAELESAYGWSTQVVQNPTRNQMLTTLREYTRKSFGPQDQLLIFFAGHGTFDEEFSMGYIVTKDSRKGDDSRSSYVSFSELNGIVDGMKCKHILLALDVCFGGTFDRFMANNFSGATRGEDPESFLSLKEILNRKSPLCTRRMIAASANSVVSDGKPGSHSPFARGFLGQLRSYGGKDGFITYSNLVAGLERIRSGPNAAAPHSVEFGRNEPGSDFFFVAREKKPH